jgi:Ser/Thr protein kinase RdoA (MazF antagonist)
MDRETILKKYETDILKHAITQFNLNSEDLNKFDAYEGCANLVYTCSRKNQPVILRVSYRQDRPMDQITAELDFINYLAENGVQIARSIYSCNDELVAKCYIDETPFYLVCFEKGRGMRVPDNAYRYRADAPIEEYFHNWGKVLGQMHRLAKAYLPKNNQIRRPDWFQLHARQLDIDATIPFELQIVRDRVRSLLSEIADLPKDDHCYGLLHGDFNDGNFTVDYSNGNMTVFDFDDCCYFWFVYELASAWEGGIGRTMYKGLEERKSFMDYYMNHVLEGYFSENELSTSWLDRIPIFIKLIQVEEFLYFVQYFHDPDEEMQAPLRYLIKCIEEDLPYMGFFDSVYSPQNPFLL